ncbi:hypothetical protein [Hwangdonia sp.]|uniref:hypothetical protein n=1 Tax=Hwangdonia sp. TaxID=1883432 RepID=UPI003AB7140C
MKIKRFFKILLLICCLLLTSMSIALMYSVIIVEKGSFEYSMLIPLLMVPTGALSVIYHFKTFKYYNFTFNTSIIKDVVLWVGNVLFAISTFLMAFFMLYSIYSLNKTKLSSELYSIIIFCGIIFLIVVFLIIEEIWLYKRIINTKEQSRLSNIDGIKGNIDDKI